MDREIRVGDVVKHISDIYGVVASVGERQVYAMWLDDRGHPRYATEILPAGRKYCEIVLGRSRCVMTGTTYTVHGHVPEQVMNAIKESEVWTYG